MTFSPVDDDIVLPLPSNPLAAKVAHAYDLSTAEMVEMDREAMAMYLALLTKNNVAVIGPPGTGKTVLADRIMARVGLRLFRYQFHPMTGVENVFGPLDMPTFRTTGAYVHRTKNYLPEADAFLGDELFNGGHAIQQAMHAAVLERAYQQGGEWVRMPLRSTIALANDVPTGKETRAFYDRFVQVLWTTSIQDTANFVSMWESSFDEDDIPEQILSKEDLDEAYRQIKQIIVPREIADAVAMIRRELANVNIEPSDRRLKQLRRLLQAVAWLEGSDEVTTEHLPILINGIPRSEEQIPDVEKVVLEYSNPLERESLTLLKDVDEITDLVEKGMAAQDKEERSQLGREAYQKMTLAHNTFKSLRERAGASRRQAALLNQIKSRQHQNSQNLLTKVFEDAAGSESEESDEQKAA